MKAKLIPLLVGLAVSLPAAGTYADDFSGDPNASANNPALTDQQFVRQAANGNDKVIYLSQLALQKSQNPRVRHFASKVIRDHSNSNAKLAQVATSEGLNMPPGTFAAAVPPSGNRVVTSWGQANPANTSNETQQKPATELAMPPLMNTNQMIGEYPVSGWQSLSGPDFDRAYANTMVNDHRNDIALYQNASRHLQDQRLRTFARKSLPTLREHYRMAQELQDQVNSQGSTDTGKKMKSSS